MTLLRSLIASLLLLGSAPWLSAVTIPDSIRNIISRPDAAPCEGVWQFARDGAVMAVTANTSGSYNITSLDSPDLYIAPGTLLGTVQCTSGDATEYEWAIFTDTNARGSLIKKRKFNAVLSGQSTNVLTITPQGINAKLNFWMLFRCFVNMSVRSQHKTKSVEATRIYPINPHNATKPIVL